MKKQQKEEVKEVCPECGGTGQVVIGENRVSHDMAIDAGEPEMEGMHHSYVYGECLNCEGVGYIIKTPTSSDTFIEGELMEKLADIEHQRWSDWQKWVHSKCVKASLKDGHLESKEYGEAYFIPPILYDRWERQIKTPYSELSEKEKESDREQVRRYLPLLKSSLQEQRQSILEEIEKELLEDLQHDKNHFCKHYGEQFKECAKCYVERKFKELK